MHNEDKTKDDITEGMAKVMEQQTDKKKLIVANEFKYENTKQFIKKIRLGKEEKITKN